MKNTTSVLAIFAAAVLAGCSLKSSDGDFSGLPTTDIEVTVTCGKPDTRFAGTIVIDGQSVEKSGTGKATFHATGHKFVCSFKKTDQVGRISIEVSEAGKNLGNSNADIKNGGVRAEVLRIPTEQHTIFTTF